MTVYRYQCVAVGMWRGKIKRWNTTFHKIDPSSTSTIYAALQAAGWPNPADAVGACSGGVASISVYDDTAGGAPIAVTTYFDWQTPSTWIPFTGTGWGSVASTTPIDASGESALIVIGHMPGLSVSGKPVTTRKYLHAVPSRTAAAYDDPDVASADLASLAALFTPSMMSNPAGQAPSSVTVAPYYGNHQRVRGRRRTTSQVAQQSFSSGVVVGAGASGSGGGSFQSGVGGL